MCFEPDSRPPIAPIAGGAADSAELVLKSGDGNRSRAFRARAANPSGAGIIVLPDVRGLHPYYEELALRFAEAGVEALAIDYFGRTAGVGARAEDFDFMRHVGQTTYAGLSSDIGAAAAHLRSSEGGDVQSLFTIGFCFAGRLAFDSATMGLGLAGAIGFYGSPIGPGRGGTPAPAEVADKMKSPILGVFGGADPSIPRSAIEEFETALGRAGVEHRIVAYPDAPHSFFDRKAEEFGAASADAWQQVLGFVEANTASTAPA